jgi:hypothetical protein
MAKRLINKRKNEMNSQQLHDLIIEPTLKYMSGNYNSKDARFLLLCTAAIESKCGYYIEQIKGPAKGIWQMEPDTALDIWKNCDALKDGENIGGRVSSLALRCNTRNNLALSPSYACAMARLKYSMDSAPLPKYDNFRAVYDYYKRIYNTPAGASTYEKFKQACIECNIFEVDLG